MPDEISPSKPKTVLNATLLVFWIIFMVGLYYLSTWTGIGNRPGLIRTFHRGVARLFNLEIEYQGDLLADRPTLYLCNHVSYIDVFVLGSILPGSFIAKSEVAGWPVFGKLATYQNTLFFERKARRAAQQVEIMRQHLSEKSNLILFPEGTSTPGTHVEPFRSSLLAAAEADDVPLQPVTVAYTHYDGHRMDQDERDYYAWYIPMPFLSHFLDGLGLRRARAKVIFHEPVRVADFESRKACARHCEEAVRSGLLDAIGEEKEIRLEKYLEAVGQTV